MPYCTFCGKLCSTAPGLERHITRTPNCKKASGEMFGQYAINIWDDVPANPNHAEQQQPADLPDFADFHELADFQLEEDIQIAEDMLYGEENNLPQQPPPPPQHVPQPLPLHAAVDVPNDDRTSGRYIENFPEEFRAGATWGRCKSLFECLDEEHKFVGGSRWAPFEDEEEWRLAEWLIRNVGQKQTDSFLKLPIVSFYFPRPHCQYILSLAIDRLKIVHDPPMGVIVHS
jgi:hypothetical protein